MKRAQGGRQLSESTECLLEFHADIPGGALIAAVDRFTQEHCIVQQDLQRGTRIQRASQFQSQPPARYVFHRRRNWLLALSQYDNADTLTGGNAPFARIAHAFLIGHEWMW